MKRLFRVLSVALILAAFTAVSGAMAQDGTAKPGVLVVSFIPADVGQNVSLAVVPFDSTQI